MSEQGNFIWYELTTPDVPAAMTFYKEVIGWGTDKFEGADPPYWVWTADGSGIGGVMAMTDESKKINASPGWIAYVLADDIDALTKKAIALGATSCVAPTDIPRVGRFSTIADPQGAVLSLMTPIGPDRPPPAGPGQGHVVWRELLSNDTDAELRFYGELLGWQKTRSFDMGANGAYQIYGTNGRELGGMFDRPAGYPLPPHWLYYVHVSDLDDAIERVKRGGGKIWNGPMPIPSGERIAQCADPQGAVFALHGD